MLLTRLSSEKMKVQAHNSDLRRIVDELPGSLTETKAITLANQFDVDYVVFGSVTALGESISTDVSCIDFHKKKAIVVFNETGKSLGDVISHINLFSQKVNSKILGIKITPESELAQSGRQFQQKDTGRRHPEALWQEEYQFESNQQKGGSFIFNQTSSPGTAGSIWRSKNFKAKIIGIAVGDVDGDGQNEIVSITENAISVLRYSAKRLLRISKSKEKTGSRFIAVDVGDINKNGSSEIFITSINRSTNRLNSFVLEWDGSSLIKISENVNLYFRIIKISENDSVLFGQHRGGLKNLFSKKLYRLVWQGDGYQTDERQILPKRLNIFSFAIGDVKNDGEKLFVGITSDQSIGLFTLEGSEVWKGGEDYFGSGVYLEYPSDQFEVSDKEGAMMDRYFLPQRIHITDFNKDGKNEIFLSKNTDSTGSILPRIRMFKNGRMICLAWNNLGLYNCMQTYKISGHISDSAVADLNNDGQDELVYAVVSKTSLLSGKPKSYIISQSID
ncbi:VCBS repeat-containing protein [Desulfococcaceae bacterium HSG7]|nr:VCBS repeat-containing protein [Desulfococcaceae bacterium HSG7]